MASVMAIVSKAVYERDARLAGGQLAQLGDVWPLDVYLSKNRALETLSDGGDLFLVTVRPPKEQLWLVAVLHKPSFDGECWRAQPNQRPVVDISGLKDQLRFATGKGIKAKPGALGMSLQTPRALCDEDCRLLAAAAGAPAPAASSAGTVDAAELLQAVFDRPDDDGPRLVLADHLQEKGHPRGEFIVVQCRLAGRDLFFSERRELRQRQTRLLETHQRQWTKPLKLSAETTFTFRRGFVDALETSLEAMLKAGARVFEHEPVRALKLTDCEAELVAKLARARWLENVEQLKLSGDVGDEGLEALARSKLPRRLKVLNVGDSGVGVDGASALADAPWLGQVERLSLSGNEISDEGLASLVESTRMASCQALYVSRNEITDDGVLSLARSPHLGQLRLLALNGNEEISDDGARALLEGGLGALRRLELEDTSVEQQTVQELEKRFAKVKWERGYY